MTLLRSLDGLLYTGVALLLLLAYLISGRLPSDLPDTLLCLPALAVGWAAWRMPATWPERADWAGRVLALRVSALGFAALSAPAIWWLSFPDQPYLLLNFVAALLAGVSTCLQVVLLLELIGLGYRWPRLRWLGRGLRFAVLYLMGIPVVSVSVAGVILGHYNKIPVHEAFLVLRVVVPGWAMQLGLLPLALLLLTLAWARYLPLTEPPAAAPLEEPPAHV